MRAIWDQIFQVTKDTWQYTDAICRFTNWNICWTIIHRPHIGLSSTICNSITIPWCTINWSVNWSVLNTVIKYQICIEVPKYQVCIRSQKIHDFLSIISQLSTETSLTKHSQCFRRWSIQCFQLTRVIHALNIDLQIISRWTNNEVSESAV